MTTDVKVPLGLLRIKEMGGFVEPPISLKMKTN